MATSTTLGPLLRSSTNCSMFGKNKQNSKNADSSRHLPFKIKNAVMLLHEQIPDLQFQLVTVTGPCHAPTFTVQTELNGQVYRGSGPTKKKARMKAALDAVLSSVQFQDTISVHHVLSTHRRQPEVVDFTSDYSDDGHNGHRCEGLEDVNIDDADKTPLTPCRQSHLKARSVSSTGSYFFGDDQVQWNAVSVLNDIRPQTRYVQLPHDPTIDAGWRGRTTAIQMSVTVDGKTFVGSGRCRRSAKQKAAQAALKRVFNMKHL